MQALSFLVISPQTTKPLIDWSVPWMEVADIAIKLGLATVLAALLGWERGRADKPAGIRTMILISIGAATFAILGTRVIGQDMTSGAESIIRADPTRVLSYIISGVGFVGAGAILHSKKAVKGLTTAASIWVVAAIGAACGLGEYAVALVVFTVAFVSLWIPWVYYEITDADLPEPPKP
ncbi:MAG: MgtC/SapB family protein [Phycisphaerales bacterium]|nr:MgtC/SapB family protein [Phycisphaerales bacterium]